MSNENFEFINPKSELWLATLNHRVWYRMTAFQTVI